MKISELPESQSGPAFDEDGFLMDPKSWSEDIALKMAHNNRFDDLTLEQWSIVRALRDFYKWHGNFPTFHQFNHQYHWSIEEVAINFNDHPLIAWQIAGMPNPGEELKTYVNNMIDQQNSH